MSESNVLASLATAPKATGLMAEGCTLVTKIQVEIDARATMMSEELMQELRVWLSLLEAHVRELKTPLSDLEDANDRELTIARAQGLLHPAKGSSPEKLMSRLEVLLYTASGVFGLTKGQQGVNITIAKVDTDRVCPVIRRHEFQTV